MLLRCGWCFLINLLKMKVTIDNPWSPPYSYYLSHVLGVHLILTTYHGSLEATISCYPTHYHMSLEATISCYPTHVLGDHHFLRPITYPWRPLRTYFESGHELGLRNLSRSTLILDKSKFQNINNFVSHKLSVWNHQLRGNLQSPSMGAVLL